MVVFDAHIHVYPVFDLKRVLGALARNLERLAPGAHALAILSERHDCHFYADAQRGDGPLPADTAATRLTDGALRLRLPGDRVLDILPGRQIQTREQVELHAMLSDISIPDGTPTAQAIEQVLAVGGIPSLCWSPGKWTGRRGETVARTLAAATPGRLLLTDTVLRPAGFSEAPLMEAARARGFGVVAGTDPFPYAGEEELAGSYGCTADGGFNADRPLESLRRILAAGNGLQRVGHRLPPWRVAGKLAFHLLYKRLSH